MKKNIGECNTNKLLLTKMQYHWMKPDEVTIIKDIDRSERIHSGYQYVDGKFQQIAVNWDSPPWAVEGDDGYTVAAQLRFCQGHLERYGYFRTCQTNNVFVDILRKNELE